MLRLCWSSETFAGVALYRLRIALKKRGVAVLPAILNRLAIAMFNINIDDHIVIRGGLFIPHGNVVLGGFTLIGRNAEIGPWASIGTRAGSFQGPVLGDDVSVGAHCSVLGTMTLGDGSTILPGSVVAGDVAAGTTVAGVPAREVERDASDIRLVKQ
jgi:serine O-acetyltransferase